MVLDQKPARDERQLGICLFWVISFVRKSSHGFLYRWNPSSPRLVRMRAEKVCVF